MAKFGTLERRAAVKRLLDQPGELLIVTGLGSPGYDAFAAGDHNLAQLLADTGLASSKGEARRLIEQGGVRVNGDKATAANADIAINADGVLLQVGKRKFLRLISL